MTAISETILTNNVHPGDSSNESVIGENFKGDGYYGRSDGFHTVQYSLNGFIGDINIQASLAVQPNDDDWFSIAETAHTSTSADSTTSTGGFIYNFTGNYVWVRANVSNWVDGAVKQILLNH